MQEAREHKFFYTEKFDVFHNSVLFITILFFLIWNPKTNFQGIFGIIIIIIYLHLSSILNNIILCTVQKKF